MKVHLRSATMSEFTVAQRISYLRWTGCDVSSATVPLILMCRQVGLVAGLQLLERCVRWRILYRP